MDGDKKAADEEEHVMRLDPGPRRRSAASSCSFCLLIVTAITVISGLIIVPLIFKFVSGVVYAFREPHHALYHNASVPDAPAIHPLLRTNSTFDIVATVWVRAPRAEEREFNVQQGGGDEEAEKAYDEIPLEDVPYLLEYPLFSDVVFRGLHMHDKHNSTEVNFTLPTARFQDKNFTILDLRASFVLIPSSPSPLDHLVNFSSWRSDDIGPLPVRPWPLLDAPASAPISSGHLDERSLLDAAIDSFGFSISLLEVQEIASVCVPHNDTRATPEDSAPGDVAEDVNNGESTTPQAEPPLPGHDEEKSHKKHPHVVTRTQLRLIIDENVYNLTAYNAAHEKLKATACGRQNKSGLKPARGFCTRSYRTHGPLGTRPEVMRPTEEMSEWLYAPYLASLGNAAGPMDQLPIPVNRENCSARNMSTPEASTALPFTPMDSMNVTWHLSFTGRTPAKDAAAKLYPHLTVPHNATMLQRQQVQELSELASGLFGYRYHKDAHPRRRLFVMGLRKVAEWTASLFTLHYWYTCSSTVGLSLRGQVLYASVDMMEAVFQAAMKLSSGADRGALYWAYTGVFFVITHLQPLLMFKALWRFELLSAGWHLYLRRSRATHRERASARLDAKLDWRMIAIGSAALVAVYYTLAPWRHAVLGSFDWSNTRQSQEGLQRFYAYVLPAMLALRYVTDLLQLAMNIRTRTFAGRSRVAIALLLLARLPKYPIRILGLSTLPSGVSWDDALSDVSLLAFAWQALTMRLVDETAEDDDGRYTSYIDVSSLIIRYLVYFWRLL